MLRKTALLAGVLVLAGNSDLQAQPRPVATQATVRAKLEVLDPVAVTQGPVELEFEGGLVAVSSEWKIAGRVPVVMAAHVLPAPVMDRSAVRGGRHVERETWWPATLADDRPGSKEALVSRHTVLLREAPGGYRVVWYVAVAL